MNLRYPKKSKSHFVCPATRVPLFLISQPDGKSFLASDDGPKYPFELGFPNLIYPYKLSAQAEKTRLFYDDRVDDYDKYLPLTFHTHNEDELEVRNRLVDLLKIVSGNRVLDIACGTGRDSEIIAERLGDSGELFMLDISSKMLLRCFEKMKRFNLTKEFCLANAACFPFPDNFFDAVYSFGGLGEFPDIKKSLYEMARVTKVGGKVVVGDESIPPWLRKTKFSKILTTTNPQFVAELPLKEIPIEARDVHLQWVIGGVFYVIDFCMGEGEPTANFDFPVPGPRGGTYRTRYKGQLEGVTPEAKQLYIEAARKTNKSLHGWLDEVIREAASRDLAD